MTYHTGPSSWVPTRRSVSNKVYSLWGVIVHLNCQSEGSVQPVGVQRRADVGSDEDGFVGLGVEGVEVVYAMGGESFIRI